MKLIFAKSQIPQWNELSRAKQKELAKRLSPPVFQQPAVFIPAFLQMAFAIWLIAFSPAFPGKTLMFLPLIFGTAALAFVPYHNAFAKAFADELKNTAPKIEETSSDE